MNTHPITTPASPSLASSFFDVAFDSIESVTTPFATSSLPTLETTTVTEVALGYHRNGQYSITAMTTSTGVVAKRYAYTAYGQPTILNASGSPIGNQQSQIANLFTYTGREWDETLGMHHFRARWMSPLAGRFLGRDPIGYYRSIFNLMNYVGSRPLIAVDPSGLEDKIACKDFLHGVVSDPGGMDLPEEQETQLKHGPALMCGNCKPFENVAWTINGRCHICFSDSKDRYKDDWISLLIHELTHCKQDKCKRLNENQKVEVIDPSTVTMPDSADISCKDCRMRETEAYKAQYLYLFPGNDDEAKAKRNECERAGVCYSCKEPCKANELFNKDCANRKFPEFEPPRLRKE